MPADDEILEAELVEPVDLDKLIAEQAAPGGSKALAIRVPAEVVAVRPATQARRAPAATPIRPWSFRSPDWALLVFLIPFGLLGLTLWLVIA